MTRHGTRNSATYQAITGVGSKFIYSETSTSSAWLWEILQGERCGIKVSILYPFPFHPSQCCSKARNPSVAKVGEGLRILQARRNGKATTESSDSDRYVCCLVSAQTLLSHPLLLHAYWNCPFIYSKLKPTQASTQKLGHIFAFCCCCGSGTANIPFHDINDRILYHVTLSYPDTAGDLELDT